MTETTRFTFPNSILSECTALKNSEFASAYSKKWRKDLTKKQKKAISDTFKKHASKHVFLRPNINYVGKIYDAYYRLKELRWAGEDADQLWGTFDNLNVCKAPTGYYVSTVIEHHPIEPQSEFGTSIPLDEFKGVIAELFSHISLDTWECPTKSRRQK